MAKERFLFIDILKGISILLVAYGHIIPGAIPSFTEYAGIFRMPLFFFVSGVLFSNERYKNNFKDFIYKRYKGLVIPYLYFSAIVLFGYMLLNKDYSSFLLHTLLYGWGGVRAVVYTCVAMFANNLLSIVQNTICKNTSFMCCNVGLYKLFF